MFGKIDRRLRQAKNNDQLFGGISVILIGDPGQLLPVGQSPLYDTRLKDNISQTGFIAYQQFKIVITLEAIMRQQNLDNDEQQAQFIDLLPRLRDGTSTIADWKLLQTRNPTAANLIGFENALSIFNDNDSVDKMNLEQLKKKKEPITDIRAINSSIKAQGIASSHFNNLENSIVVSKDCVITIISNLWKKKGTSFNKNQNKIQNLIKF